MRRFWNKVDKSRECWEWTASKTRDGYGRFRFHEKTVGAHRMAWALSKGEIPSHVSVLHRCDNKICVNPSHLFLGTQADNIRDRCEKGRSAIGENQGSAKLRESEVLEIRVWLDIGYSLGSIARAYKICRTSVWNIKSGKLWSHFS